MLNEIKDYLTSASDDELFKIHNRLKSVLIKRDLVQVYGKSFTIRDKEVGIYIMLGGKATVTSGHRQLTFELSRGSRTESSGYVNSRNSWFDEITDAFNCVLRFELTPEEKQEVCVNSLLFEEITYQLI